MGIAEKIYNAKKTNWLSEGLSEEEIKEIMDDAKAKALEYKANNLQLNDDDNS